MDRRSCVQIAKFIPEICGARVVGAPHIPGYATYWVECSADAGTRGTKKGEEEEEAKGKERENEVRVYFK